MGGEGVLLLLFADFCLLLTFPKMIFSKIYFGISDQNGFDFFMLGLICIKTVCKLDKASANIINHLFFSTTRKINKQHRSR